MATQQFLNSVLSQRGPTALPYSEDVKWLIRQHIVSLVHDFPSLHPETASFTHNDGRSVHLLRADGTIPMSFQGVTYNIPIIIWLMESYPRYSPLVFVNPTRDMVIKRVHPNVNPSGLVSIPYLNNWVYPSSNLAELARNLSHIFSCDPPLYSRQRPNPSENPRNNPNINSYSSNSGPNPRHNPNPYSSNSGSSPRNNSNPNSSLYSPISSPNLNSDSSVLAPSRGYPPSSYGGRIPPTEDQSEVFRRNAINKLSESLFRDMSLFGKTKEEEMEGLFGVQTVLRQREVELSNGMKGMMEEKEGLEQQLQMVLMYTDLLEGWVRENQGRKMENLSMDEDDGGFVTCDSLSQQMLDSTAADLAIEDTVYSLDRAVQEGSVPFDQYLKNVRMLSREQFFHRAMAAKVRAAQMQSQVANMSSRISSYVS